MTHGPTQLATETVADWRVHAACAGYPNRLFFPTDETADEQKTAKAKAICQACPVLQDCLTYSLETNQRSGIWGGTTEKERKSLRRKWLAERRRSA